MTKVVAITGGIGSGKTTLSDYLKKTGFLVHESDEVVSDMYTKPSKSFISFIKENISKEAIQKNKANKKEITNIIFSNLKAKLINEKYYNFNIENNGNKINIFFDKNSYDLVGWQTEDIYQNLVITYIYNIKKNKNIDEKLFNLPKQH